MLGTRLVFLLLAFLLSFAVSQPVEMLLGGLADLLPGAAQGWLFLAALFLGSGAQFFAAGVLFTLLSGLSWKKAAVWTMLGTAALNFLCAGPAAISTGYLFTELASVAGGVRAVLCVAAGVYGCWWLEQRELAPWVDQARAMILSMIGQ